MGRARARYLTDEGRIVELNNQGKHAVSNWSDAWRVHLIFDYLCDDDTDETDENDAAERGAGAAGAAGAALPRVVPAHRWPAPPPPVRLAAGEVLRQTRRSIDRALDRSLDPSIDCSLDRPLDRSLKRSIAWWLSRSRA